MSDDETTFQYQQRPNRKNDVTSVLFIENCNQFVIIEYKCSLDFMLRIVFELYQYFWTYTDYKIDKI